MTIQIIDQPFHRLLHGLATTHVPGQPYGPDIIRLLDQIWPAVRTLALPTTGINHVVYDGDTGLFAGIETTAPVPATAALVPREITLPRYAYARHVGPYQGLPACWNSVLGELRARGLEIGRPGLEIYGHWNADESLLETEILIPLAAVDAPGGMVGRLVADP